MTVHTELYATVHARRQPADILCEVNKASNNTPVSLCKAGNICSSFSLAKVTILYSVITPKSHIGTTDSMCHTLHTQAHTCRGYF